MGNSKWSLECVCHSTLQPVQAKDAYPDCNALICDICGETVHGDAYVYHCARNSTHPRGFDVCGMCIDKPKDERRALWTAKKLKERRMQRVETSEPTEQQLMNGLETLHTRLITLDLGDDKENEVCDVAKLPNSSVISPTFNTNDIVLTYYHGKNKYRFTVEKRARDQARGHFKQSFRATLYESERVTNQIIDTPNIADGTSVVIKVKHRNNAGDNSYRKAMMTRNAWDEELRELHRLERYTEVWNKGGFANKTYHVSKAFVLKVSSEGDDGIGQFIEGEYVLVEPYMPNFKKWNWPNGAEAFAEAYSIQAFSHFTYHLSGGEELVNDAQGYRDDTKYILTDPYYLQGNDMRCIEWFWNHKCNKFCKQSWKRPSFVPRQQLSSAGRYVKRAGHGSVRPTEL